MIYWKLFWTFLQIGLFTIGGGYAMLPMIQEEVVSNQWLSLSSLIDFIAVSESTPGPFAVNIATYVGMEVGGIGGALCATLGVVLPSFVIILVVARYYQRYRNSYIMKESMHGIKPAVIGLVAAALLSIGEATFFVGGASIEGMKEISFGIMVMMVLGMLVISFRKIHPIVIVIISAILGIIFGYSFGLS